MTKKYSLEKRFFERLEKSQQSFGYISLETIVNCKFKHHVSNRSMIVKKSYSINESKIRKRPVTQQFKDMLQQKVHR